MKEFIERLIKQLKTLQQYYIYSIDDLVRLEEVEKVIKNFAEPYADYETVRSNRLDCEVPSDCFEQIKEVHVIDEWTEEKKVFKEYSEGTPQKSANGWIDCEKDIPKENGWYWGYYVTSSYTDENGVEHRECKYASIYWEDNLWLYDPRGFRTVDRVIAWQHIPEYYKPQQESEWKDKVMKHFTNVE